mmetsp:Transcript_35355/g.83845  ORF Transcript_35355/g.83845 Transcript_35355/m.83845 type:complete len:246 (-) Transcript_35355:482-1219(-)
MVRLVFRPYTQVRKAICTSAHLRASTRVSSGFALLRHSSPSFGSQQVCSSSNLSQQIMVGPWCRPRQRPSHKTFLVSFRRWACHPPTRIHVRLLGPCFKTGCMSSFRQHPYSAQIPKGVRSALLPRSTRGHSQASNACSSPNDKTHADTPPAPRQPAGQGRAFSLGATTPLIHFPLSNFKHFLTLFPKVFSSFPRGTCSLSVSCQYLALEGMYLPIRTGFSTCPTRRGHLVERCSNLKRRGSHPL